MVRPVAESRDLVSVSRPGQYRDTFLRVSIPKFSSLISVPKATCLGDEQAHNQLRILGREKSFPRGAQIFLLMSKIFFHGGEKISKRELSPLAAPLVTGLITRKFP